MSSSTQIAAPLQIESTKQLLAPTERIGEVLFGLIMVLTFTGSLSVADAGRDDVRMMLIGALGCNIAWGIIDGIFYLMDCLSEEARNIRALRTSQGAPASDAHKAIADAMPKMLAAALSPAELESMRQKLVRLPPPPARPHLGKREWLAAVSVFFWVFVTTFPVSIPYFFQTNVQLATRMSNAIAIVLLFITGIAYGRNVGYRPWLTGMAMIVVGALLVSMTIALGG